MRRPKSLSEVTKEWIESIPKTISANGCWIPIKKPSTGGYIQMWIGNNYLLLHRVVLSIYYNVDYYDKNIVTRHGPNCTQSCFLYSHLTPGSDVDNAQDKILHGKNHNINKDKCPKCGGIYTEYARRTGLHKGLVRRKCKICQIRYNARRWKLKKGTAT